MQEEVENKVVVMISGCSRLTARELRQALSKLLSAWKQRRRTTAVQKQPKDTTPHGKMTVKQLAAKERGMQSIEVNDRNIGSFNRVSRKYGIDFAPYKVKGKKKYLIFFKGPDADAMTAAFTEYTQKEMRKASRPSVLHKLALLSAHIKHPKRDKTRHKEPER